MSSFLRALAAILVALGAAIATPSNVFAAVPVYNDVVVDVRSGTDFSTRRDGMTRALEEAAPPPLAPPQLTLAGTTTARAATFTYDGPSPTRVGIHVDGAASAVPALLNGQREESASFTVTDRSTATTPSVSVVATNTVDDLVGSAKPWDLQRTETLVGRGSQAKVDDIAASMRENGWVGDPIEVFQANGQNYIVNGHHRVAAARQAGIDVQYRVVSQTELLTYYPGGVSQLVSAASEARPGRVR